MAFTVVHHTNNGRHEATSTVISDTKWNASLLVEGEVMHVSEGERLYAGKTLRSSSWSTDFKEPSYPRISEEWRRYLLLRNFNGGNED